MNNFFYFSLSLLALKSIVGEINILCPTNQHITSVSQQRKAGAVLLAIYGKLEGSGSSDVTHGLHEVSATDPFEVPRRQQQGKETE